MEYSKFRWWDISKRTNYPDHEDMVLAAMWRPDHEDYYFFVASWNGDIWREWGSDSDIESNSGYKVVKWSEIPEPTPPKNSTVPREAVEEKQAAYISIMGLGLSESGARSLLTAGIYGVKDLTSEAWECIKGNRSLTGDDVIKLSEIVSKHEATQ